MTENEVQGIVVRNLRDPDREIVFSKELGARKAVICAHAQSLGDWNTADYEDRYGHLAVEGRWHWFCGDHGTRKAEAL